MDLAREGHTLDFFLGLQDRALFGAEELFLGRPADQTVLSCENVPGLFLCPASDAGRLFSEKELSALLERVSLTVPFDVAVLDLPPQAASEAFYKKLADVHLVVSTAQPSALLLAEKTAELLGQGDGAYLLLNQFDLADPSSYRRGRTRAYEMIDAVGLPLIGIVPYEYDLLRRSEAGELSRYEAQADRPFDNVVSRLEGEQRLLFEGMKEGKSLRRSL